MKPSRKLLSRLSGCRVVSVLFVCLGVVRTEPN